MIKRIVIIITVIILIIILTNYLIKLTQGNEGFSFFTIRRNRERRALTTTTTKPLSVLAAPIIKTKAFNLKK